MIQMTSLERPSNMHIGSVRQRLIWKFHRQSTLCSAMEIEALQLYLFDVVDKKQR